MKLVLLAFIASATASVEVFWFKDSSCAGASTFVQWEEGACIQEVAGGNYIRAVCAADDATHKVSVWSFSYMNSSCISPASPRGPAPADGSCLPTGAPPGEGYQALSLRCSNQ